MTKEVRLQQISLKIIFVVYNESVKDANAWLKLCGVHSTPSVEIIYVRNKMGSENYDASETVITGSNDRIDVSGYYEGFSTGSKKRWSIFVNETVLKKSEYVELMRRLLGIVCNVGTTIPILAGVIDRTNILSNVPCYTAGYVRTNLFLINDEAYPFFVKAYEHKPRQEEFDLLMQLHCGYINPFFGHPKFSSANVSHELKVKKIGTLFFESEIANLVYNNGYIIGVRRGVFDRLRLKIIGLRIFFVRKFLVGLC